MPFQIIRNDITKVKADAIVNTANPEVAIGDGVDSAIYKAAGEEELLAARAQVGYLAPGEVGVTPAYRLDAKYIIHASGIWWRGGAEHEAEILKLCYERSLTAASELQCESIAFPLLATGSYGFPKELGIQIAVDSFTEFLEDHDMEITLVVFGNESLHVSGTLVDEVRSYIDDAYVEDAMEEEYSASPRVARRKEHKDTTVNPETVKAVKSTPKARKAEHNPLASLLKREFSKSEARGSTESLSEASMDRMGTESLSEASMNRMGTESISKASMDWFGTESLPEASMDRFGAAPAPGAYDEQSLDHILKGIYTDSFEKHLQQIINKKGLKNSEVYAAANISKQYFSKLLKGQVKPSKEKVLALAVGLRLNMDETVDFLRIAGYALSPISQTDAVVRYFIAHEDYNVLKIDIVLFDYGLDPLSGGA